MKSKKKIAILLLAASLLVMKIKTAPSMKPMKKRRMWVMDWLKGRQTDGAHQKLLKEFRTSEEQKHLYKNFLRMDETSFNELLLLVTPLIAKQDSVMRKSISASERLAVTLRFLATGDSYRSLAYLFKKAPNTISKIIPEVCDAIYKVLKDKYLKMPQTQEDWSAVAEAFEEMWNFPNCIGAVDGKHIVMIASPNSGSTFFNYKTTIHSK